MEENDNWRSISNSVFACVPRKKKQDKNQHSLDEGNFGKRYDLYKETWKRLEEEIQLYQRTMQLEFTDTVINFVRNASTSYARKIENSEIPVAALIMGTNVLDHSAVFDTLKMRMKSEVTRLVISLQSKDCNSMPAMIQKIFAKIFQEVDEELNLKKTAMTLSTLANWYSSLAKKTTPTSPRKKRKSTNHRQIDSEMPVIIILEDVFNFCPETLQDFILICSRHISRLPLIFVFGLSTNIITIHRLITHKAASCLAIETFASVPAPECLNQILHKMLLDFSVPFKFGLQIFQLITETILYHNFSLTGLFYMLKICIFKHYCSKAEAVLCCRVEDLESAVQSLSKAEVDLIKKLPSFQKCDKEEIKVCKEIKKLITSLVKDLHVKYEKNVILLKTLHELAKKLPGEPLGRQLRELYLLSLEKPLQESEEFEKFIKLFKILSREEIEERLRNTLSALQEFRSTLNKQVLRDMEKQLIHFLDRSSQFSESNSAVETPKEPATLQFEKGMTRSQLKDKLMELSKNKKLSPFETYRNELCDYLKETFAGVVLLKDHPLYETLYLDSSEMKKHFIPVRSVTHPALTKPYNYLKCDCCKNARVEGLSASLPELAIAYKLHLEYGRYINIYDWMQSFKSILHKPDLKEEENKVLEAQFLMSVKQLQFLGCIKSTKRKVDHVERLLWESE